jgi:hypothetical protein
MKSKYILLLVFTIINYSIYGQDTSLTLKGTVTFVTSKNIYVTFDNTEKIKIGDSLKISTQNTACLLVKNKSSSSVVCILINDCAVKKGDIVIYHNVNMAIEETKIEELLEEEKISNVNDQIKETEYIERINARLSLSSNSTLSDVRDDRHRLMTRFSLNATHINNTKFSVETYLNYRKNFLSGNVNSDRKTSFFNVYNFAVTYEVDTTLFVTVGRKINYKASSLGAIDGLQAEKYFGKNYVGVLVGFRPDFIDYGFNSDLFQYGAYIGTQTNRTNFYSETTLGFAQQTNNGEIDRRYTYFQHSSRLFKKLNLFSSMELDLYSKVNDTITNDIRLTNLYVSARYRFNRKINAALSYDSRKRIIYYETLQTDIERLLNEDIARQGFRARVNIRPFKYISTGLSYSKRFQNNTENKSDNIYGYISMSRLPKIGGRVSVSYNTNSSNYLKSNIASIRYSRTFLDQRLNADIYYRFVNYKYTTTVPDLNQHYFGTYLSYYIDRSLIFSLSGEYTTYNQENSYRINTRIIKRIFSQRKKK